MNLAKELPGWDLNNLSTSVKEDQSVIKQEIEKAGEALRLLSHHDIPVYDYIKSLSLADASEIIGVTRETVRNRERNRLFQSKRGGRNSKKYITLEELNELKIIYHLRIAGVSISAIHIYMNYPERIDSMEISSAGDHILEVLNKTQVCSGKILHSSNNNLSLNNFRERIILTVMCRSVPEVLSDGKNSLH